MSGVSIALFIYGSLYTFESDKSSNNIFLKLNILYKYKDSFAKIVLLFLMLIYYSVHFYVDLKGLKQSIRCCIVTYKISYQVPN
jgi:hypothetical protein